MKHPPSVPEFLLPSYSYGTAVQEQPQIVGTARSKPVLVTGASGLVGTHTCRELVKAGFKVRAFARDASKAASRLAHLPVDIKTGDIRNKDHVQAAVDGVGSIVHLAAIAIEQKGDSYTKTNATATQILIEAAAAAGIKRFVHMSQNGSDSSSPFPFLRSKGIAQDAVENSDLEWTILRPSVIFGPQDEFVNVLARLVKISPFVYPLPGGGTARFQPIAVQDVAHVVRICLDRPDVIYKSYSLGGPAPLTLRQMVERILTAMGEQRKLVSIPVGLLKPVVALMQKLLPHPPVTTGLVDLLALDNTVPDNAIIRDFGVMPHPFAPEEILYLRRITARDALGSLFRK